MNVVVFETKIMHQASIEQQCAVTPTHRLCHIGKCVANGCALTGALLVKSAMSVTMGAAPKLVGVNSGTHLMRMNAH